MGISTNYFKKETLDFILNNYSKDISILDIGAGSGTYFNLLSPYGYNKIDCVEAWQPYIEKFDLKRKYKQVIHADISTLDLDFSKYDLVILGDVFEHISKDKTKKLIDKMLSCDIIVAIPFESGQEAINSNPYEVHVQDDLTLFNFLDDYQKFYPLCLRFDYGVFVSKNVEKIYIESGERELPSEYYRFVLSTYKNKKIEII
jgi:SAM-dependent methyltransferase